MKSIRLYMFGIISILITGILFVSCTKTFDEKIASQKDLDNSSVVQVFNAMVNTNRNYLYMDGKLVNGGAPMTPGSLFPSTGSGINVPGGERAFLVRDTLTATTQLPLSFAQSLKASKNYTMFLYDTITTPKQKTVETDIVVPSDSTCRVRFANFIYNPNAVPGIDVFSFNRNANIFTNVNVTDVTNFVPYPSRLTTDTIYIRETGSTVNIIKIAIVGGLTEKRSYTLVYRGSHRGTRSTSFFSNN